MELGQGIILGLSFWTFTSDDQAIHKKADRFEVVEADKVLAKYPAKDVVGVLIAEGEAYRLWNGRKSAGVHTEYGNGRPLDHRRYLRG